MRSLLNGKLAGAGVLAVAVCSLALDATASPGSTKQRVAITVKGSDHTFVLTPLTSGPVESDAGTELGCCWGDRWVVRDGQRIEINDPLVTLTGRRGVITVRYRIEWVDAGNGYSVGTGTWRVVRGTGAYAHVTGSGRSAHAWPPSGFAGGRSEGFLITR